MTNSEVLKELRRKQGKRTQKELAADLGVTPQHLTDVLKGRRDIGPAITAALGLVKRVTYQREKGSYK